MTEVISIDEGSDTDKTPAQIRTTVYRDRSASILSHNDSPDLGFSYSVNPYRGCEHGCVYCYARPSHEQLGWSLGLDFESRLMAKPDAAVLLRQALARPGWVPQPIVLSGVTDAYQPVERQMGITRACLEVLCDAGNPVDIVTKGALVTRDLDILQAMAHRQLARVSISVTTVDPNLARRLDPRAATPARRLDAIRQLRAAGVPVGVNVSPIIPGLNDHEIPEILAAARDMGAGWARWILVRLPHGVKALMEAWLRSHCPERADRVLNKIREARGGALNDPRFGSRMRGVGPQAALIGALFDTQMRRLGLSRDPPPLSTLAFRSPAAQLRLDLGR